MRFLTDILAKAGLTVDGVVTLNSVAQATVDTDRFLVIDSGVVKYRTGAELLSDIGGVSTNIYTADGTLTGNRTVTMGSNTLSFTGDLTINSLRVGRGPGGAVNNVAVGVNALRDNTLSGGQNGTRNTAVGWEALASNTSGFTNTAVGEGALRLLSSGTDNTAVGSTCLSSITSGSRNISIGSHTGGITSGSSNIFMGIFSGGGASTGSTNIFIGNHQGSGLSGDVNNNTVIGSGFTGLSAGLSNNIIIGDGSGNQRIRIFSTGNMMVGYPSPTDTGFRLDVNGSARVTSLNINGTLITNTFNSGSLTISNSGQGNILLSASNSQLGYSGNFKFGANNNHGSAVVEIESTTRGFLMPRMTTAQRNAISSPATGLIVYDTTDNEFDYWNGTVWTPIRSTNIYNSDGTLTGNRTVTMSGNTLTFAGGNILQERNFAGELEYRIKNTTTGTTSQTRLSLETDALRIFSITKYSGTATPFKILAPYDGIIFNSQLGGDIAIYNDHANGQIKMATGGSSTAQFRIFSNGNIGINQNTDAGFRLDCNGTARATVYHTNFGTNSINLLTSGQTAQTADRGVFIGSGSFNNASLVGVAIGSNATLGTGTGNVAIGFTANASGGGIAISSSGNSAVASGAGIAIGQNSTSVGGVSLKGTSTVAGGISILGNSTGTNAIAIGNFSSATGAHSIALGDRNTAAHTFSIAIGLFSTTTGANQFVSGSNDGFNNGIISEVYFGSGVQRNGTSTGVGSNYTINGSGANGTDFAGGNITIAGGKGTGAGTPGDVIFSTSTATTTGTTLQTLTNRWWVKGGTGQLANVASPNASAIFQLDATDRGFLMPRMTITQRDAISSPATGLQIYQTNGVEGIYLRLATGWARLLTSVDTLPQPDYSTIFITNYDADITGLRNSSNKVFTLANNFVAGTTRVFVNGIRYTRGSAYDYVETGTNQITFTNAPDSGDLITVDYIKA